MKRSGGIIHILNSYKFTIAENTPVEEEIALDPELLGKVFENLLASYNPETQTTARKQTGSFYTPREIVNYMVDESLIAYLEGKLTEFYENKPRFIQRTPPSQKNLFGEQEPVQTEIALSKSKVSAGKKTEINDKLRHLVSYAAEDHLFSRKEAAAIIEALDSAKILDPACGSGAFPMGILHKMTHILSRLDPQNMQWKQRQIEKQTMEIEKDISYAEKIRDDKARQKALDELEERLATINDAFDNNELDYGRKLYLIENCIFGVDIQPIAVQIAKLRFFISLIVDQKVDGNKKNMGILPLPNLETKFVAANTLIDKKGQLELQHVGIKKKEEELTRVREKHFSARTPETKEKYREKDEDLRNEIARLLKKGGLASHVTQRLAHWNPYDQNTSAEFFDMEWMFGVKDGFDVVIGNPPYVRQEKIRELKPILKNQYECYTGTADIYVFFYENGFSLLKDDGILTFISSNKYFRSGYGRKLREYLVRHTLIRNLIDFGDAPVFTAIAYPSIITFKKNKATDINPHIPSGTVHAFNWKQDQKIEDFADIFHANHFPLNQKELTSDGWRLEPPDVLRLLDKIRNIGKPLGEYVDGRFYRGIVTGLNKVFIIDTDTKERLIDAHHSSAKIIKPLLRGQDIKRWHIEPQDLWLIFTRRGTDIKKFPAINEYLKQFKQTLTPGNRGGRKQGNYKWFEIQDNIAYWQEFEYKKIVWGNLSKEPKFSFANSGLYFSAPANIIVSSSKYLLGILNSRITQYLVLQSAAERQGGFLEFKPMYISRLAIPKQPKNEIISIFVDKIIKKINKNSAYDTMLIEAEIDSRVAHLYNLTEEEYSLILKETNCPDPFRVAALNIYRDIAGGKIK